MASLPSLCAVCHAWGMQRICTTCHERFAPAISRCGQCALQVPPGADVCGACLRDPPPFARCIAALDYAYPWDGLVTRFKFSGALELAPVFAQHLVQAARRGDASPPTLLLPVPLSPLRLRERGYNQAWELARRVGRALRIESDARLLLRVKDTPHQLALPLTRRTANVRDAFAVEPRRRAELCGREVAVIDDVMTTGATAAEVARALLQAGAAQVQLWVLARTPAPQDR